MSYFEAIKTIDAKRTSSSVMAMYVAVAKELGVIVKKVKVNDFEGVIELDMLDFIENMYRADTRGDKESIFSETLQFMVRCAKYKPSRSELDYIIKKKWDRVYKFVARKGNIEPTDAEVDAFMGMVYKEHRYHWCTALDKGELCACMGCVNRTFPWPKSIWDAWVLKHPEWRQKKRRGFLGEPDIGDD